MFWGYIKNILATFLMLLVVLSSFLIEPKPVEAVNWYHSSWDYRKSHTVGPASGAGSNYQIKLTVHYGSGSDSGSDVYLGGNSNTDFSDLRFTDDDETTLLDYWIEEKTDSVSATVWVKISDDMSSASTTIYIYYGNSGASDASDGENTFLFFDDFNDSSIDTGKWTKEAENGSITEEAGGYLRVGGGISSGTYGWSSLGSSPAYTGFQNNTIRWRAKNAANSIGEVAVRGNYASDSGYKARFDNRSSQGNGLLKPPYRLGVWNFYSAADGSSPGTETWHTYDFKLVGTNHSMYRDDSLVRNNTDSSYVSAGEVSLQNHYGSYADYDWVTVRKAAATEPAHGTWGSEETVPVLPTDYAMVASYTGAIKETVKIGNQLYDIYIFPAGTNSITFSKPGLVEYLVIGGGGSGGSSYGSQPSGGGGAGGFVEDVLMATSSTYDVTVGLGGNHPIGLSAQGSSGGDSFVQLDASDVIRADGGGGAGSGAGNDALNGGSGGGGGANYGAGGTSTPSQGFDGGSGADYKSGGGGGGASESGANATNAGQGVAGDGGDGIQSSITGTATYYAGGGGGGAYQITGTHGVGGAGGGGDGGHYGVSVPQNGIDGLGGGGGGAERTNGIAGDGGNGTVILRVAHLDYATVGSVTGATKSTMKINGSYFDVYTFPTGTNTITFSSVGLVDYLLVGGGGGGGISVYTGGGGGGGGGALEGVSTVLAQEYSLEVGAGGTGGSDGISAAPGSDSVAFSLTAYGGGDGADGNSDSGGTGGSGGGGGGGAGAGGTGTVGQGYDGGSGSGTFQSGGGGGGASEVGQDTQDFVTAGDGGEGNSASITGSPVVYGSGGGGGAHSTGGTGGIGAGDGSSGTGYGENGTDGVGGGGGGGHRTFDTPAATGGDGGDGTVILRVPSQTRRIKLFEGQTILINNGNRIKIQ